MTVSPNDRLLRALQSLPPTDAQIRLMRVSDREVALSMTFMADRDRIAMYKLVGEAKRRRITDELALQKRLAIRYDQYERAVANVVKQLEDPGPGSTLPSYLRPRRGRNPGPSHRRSDG